MSIYVTSATDLVALINAQAGVTFALADLTFAKPRAPTADELTKYGKNSAVDFKVNDSSTIATGFTTVFYDRLDFKGLENYDLTTCSIPANVGVATWLPMVISYLNVPLTAANIVDTPSATVGNNTVVTLTATAASLGWIGTGSLKFASIPDISTAFNSNQLVGF